MKITFEPTLLSYSVLIVSSELKINILNLEKNISRHNIVCYISLSAMFTFKKKSTLVP